MLPEKVYNCQVVYYWMVYYCQAQLYFNYFIQSWIFWKLVSRAKDIISKLEWLTRKSSLEWSRDSVGFSKLMLHRPLLILHESFWLKIWSSVKNQLCTGTKCTMPRASQIWRFLPYSKFEVRPGKFQNYLPKKSLNIFFKIFFSRLTLPQSTWSFTIQLSIVDLGQPTLKANATTSGWNFWWFLRFWNPYIQHL